MTALTLQLSAGRERYPIEYRSVAECLADTCLTRLLDHYHATASLWCGGLRLTARVIASSRELAEQLERNRSVIERGVAA